MRERFARFMLGRNGQDQLNSFLMVVGLVLMILGAILRSSIGSFLYGLAFAMLAICYFRMLSRNLARRRMENERYLRLRYQVQGRFRQWKTRWDQRRDYRFFTCPACHTTLRVPKGRGKIRIVCRKCGSSFTRKS